MAARTHVRFALLLSAGASLAAVPALAQAQAQAQAQVGAMRCLPDSQKPCVVTLRSGAIFVGQVAGPALEGGEPLRVQLITGEERTVPWSELVSAVPAAPPALPPVPAAPDTGLPTAALVAIDGMNPDMQLARRAHGLPGDAPWEALCAAPCQPMPVSSAYEYRVTGPSAHGKALFDVPRDASQLKLRVLPGSTSRYRAGLALMILGSSFTATAIPMYMLISTKDDTQRLAGQVGMGVSLGIGVPLISIGAYLYVTGSTRAQLTPLQSQ